MEHRPANVVPQPLVVEHEVADRLRKLLALPPALPAPCAVALALANGHVPARLLVRLVLFEYAEAYEAAVAFGEQTGAAFAHAYDQLEVAAGAGTLAEEILEDEPAIDTIIVAVGGGGLYAGVAASAFARARVVAVEPERCPTLSRAMEAGHPVDVPVSGVAADSLGARRLGDLAFAAQEKEPPTSVLVTDDDIIHARSSLWNDYRVPSEAGASTAYAALLSGRYVPEDGERVAVVICGANTHLSTLA